MSDPTEATPKDIAIAIFSEEPKPKKSIQFLSDEADHEYIFEVLLTILFEGIYCTGTFAVMDDGEININDTKVFKLKEYFWSFCFDVNLSVHTIDELKVASWDIDDRYCSISVNMENYKFYLRPSDKKREKLEDYFGLILGNDKVYKIDFSYYV